MSILQARQHNQTPNDSDTEAAKRGTERAGERESERQRAGVKVSSGRERILAARRIDQEGRVTLRTVAPTLAVASDSAADVLECNVGRLDSNVFYHRPLRLVHTVDCQRQVHPYQCNVFKEDVRNGGVACEEYARRSIQPIRQSQHKSGERCTMRVVAKAGYYGLNAGLKA